MRRVRGKIRVIDKPRPDTESIHKTSAGVVVNGQEFTLNELLEIVAKYQEQENKKYITCDRCKNKYIKNNAVNMCDVGLQQVMSESSAWGYAITPYISGLTINSTCGDGRKIHLCDECVRELVEWLGKVLPSNEHKSAAIHLI